MITNKTALHTKIIKRYQNRKLYDTQQSCYVTLDDIAKMIRANEEVTVIDNKNKKDITSATLTQIIFEAEKKACQYAPLSTLREIIQNGNGSISSYLAKLGAFPADYAEKQVAISPPTPVEPRIESTKPSIDEVKPSLEKRIANAASGVSLSNDSTLSAELGANHTPDLPNSNKSFDSAIAFKENSQEQSSNKSLDS